MSILVGSYTTIPTFGINTQFVNAQGNVTGVRLQSGLQATQEIRIINESPYTLAFHSNPAVSNVADAAFASIIPPNTGRAYVWDQTTRQWYSTYQTQNLVANVLDYAGGLIPDGNTDFSTVINVAITTASNAGGGTVFLPPGTYLHGSEINAASNVNIIGSGRATILKTAASTSVSGIKVSGCSHVTIADLQIDGNKANVTYIGDYAHNFGVYMLGASDDVTITRCYIHDCASSGILSKQGCTNLIISDNRLNANFDNQIYIRADNNSPYAPTLYATVTGNICANGSFSGIQVLGSSYVSITGNTCYNNGPTAAQGDGIGTEGASYVTITGNTCYNNGIQGIQTRYSAEVGSNQVSSHVVISGNTVYDHPSQNGDAGGIGINDSDDITVVGNLVYNNGYGIYVNGGSGLGVSHCHLIGNTVRNSANTGIRVTPGSGSDYVLQNNYVTDSGSDNVYTTSPIFVVGGVYARSATNHEGINLVSGSNNSIIQGGVFYDNLDNAILINSPVANVDIRNCYFNSISQTQKRALWEVSGAGPTRMTNCRILNQGSNPYVFHNAGSGYYDEQTINVVTVTTSYSVDANDETILCNQSGAITVTLPTAANSAGRLITIKDKSGNATSNNITIATTSSQTIDGASTKAINTNYGMLRLVSDGSNWFSV